MPVGNYDFLFRKTFKLLSEAAVSKKKGKKKKKKKKKGEFAIHVTEY